MKKNNPHTGGDHKLPYDEATVEAFIFQLTCDFETSQPVIAWVQSPSHIGKTLASQVSKTCKAYKKYFADQKCIPTLSPIWVTGLLRHCPNLKVSISVLDFIVK